MMEKQYKKKSKSIKQVKKLSELNDNKQETLENVNNKVEEVVAKAQIYSSTDFPENYNANAQELEKEQIAVIKIKEKEIKERQLTELFEKWTEFENVSKENRKKRWEEDQWEYYLQSEGKAEPLHEREVNDYISIWTELTENESATDIMKECHACLQLINRLETALDDVPEIIPAQDATWRNSHKKLQDLLHSKLDEATYMFLQHSNDYYDPETSDMHHVETDISVLDQTKRDDKEPSIVLCLWANISQHSNHEGPNFTEYGHFLKLPQSLFGTACAVRILYTTFDPFSNYCLIAQNSATESPTKLSVREGTSPDSDICTGSKIAEQRKSTDTFEISKRYIRSSASFKAEGSVKRSVKKKKNPREKKIKESKAAFIKIPEFHPMTNIEESEVEPELENLLIQPKSIQSQKVDRRDYYILGGVYHIDLFNIPPLSARVGNWIVQQVETIKTLKCIPFDGGNKDQTEMEINQSLSDSIVKMSNIVTVNIRLPKHIIYLDQVQPAFWSEETSFWIKDGLQEVNYNKENKLLTFKMTHFGKIGIIQKKSINYPYQFWELKPLNKVNHSQLTLTGKKLSIVIEILEGTCRIIKIEFLQDNILYEKKYNDWLPPNHLLKYLKEIGVFLYAEESTYHHNITPKDKNLEDKIYRSMALTSNVFMFSPHSRDSSAGPFKAFFNYAETCGKNVENIQMGTVKVTNDRCVFLKESDIIFNEEAIEDHQYSATLYHLLQSKISEEGHKRLISCNAFYCNCIYILLSTVKFLSFWEKPSISH